MYRDERVDNALVTAKNQLITRIDGVNTFAEWDEVRAQIVFVMPLWTALDYAYKVKELFTRLQRVAEDKAESAVGRWVEEWEKRRASLWAWI